MGDLVIPAGVYVQIKFESSVEFFFKMLAEQLQSNAEGVFFAQHDPRARLGCSPFHLKVIPSVNLSGRNYSKVMATLQDVGSRYDNIQGRVLPICVVDGEGVVSVKITSSDCSQIIKHISELLLGNNIWPVSHDEDLLVSIGSFNGPHTAAFEDWLNGELRTNSSVFPIFNAEFLELSESCGNFIPESVRISRKEQKQIDSSSNFKIPDIENISDKMHADRSGELSFESLNQTFDQQSAVQRLILSSTPISRKLFGTGIMKNDTVRSAPTLQNMSRYSIVPSEMSLWQEQCSNMIRSLGSLLQSVGPNEFLGALDSVSNLCHTGSLFAAMMPLLDRTAGSFLSITQINDLHIEASLGANFNNDNAAGYSVPLSVIHGSSPEEDSCETSLLCYLASGSKTVSDLRASNSTIPPPNRALLALHIRSAPLKALGLTPLHDRSVFYLPIAWIDVRNPTHIKSRPGGYVSNARVQGSNAPLGSGQKPLGPKIPSGARFNGGINTVPNNLHNPVLFPTQAVKPIIGMFGDWNCPQCKSLVFSFRLDCFKCRTPRPVSGPHIVPRQPQKTSSKPDGDIRDGDWLCACCNGHNFANKLACFTCRTVKHQDPIDESIARHPTDPADPNSVPSATDSLKAPERASKLMPGDWTCPSCSENVFAKRRRCYKCCTLKPR